MKKLLFKEEQEFSRPWIWLVLFPVLGLIIFIANIKGGEGEISDPDEMTDALGFIIMGIIFFVMMVGLTVLFYKMQLTTEIRYDGIYYKYLPFFKKERFVSKEEIREYEIRKYNPKREYRGHGVKRRRRKPGKAYTVSGRIGLQLYLNDSREILIGTHRKEAIKYAMEKMMNND